jgi:PhzF family phenazine biosynthesis protein
MRTFKLWQVDAFAARPLEGNPAAIVPLESWLDDALMQRIAGENNVSETAFFVKTGDGRYNLRWFTPAAEIDLCGHATLASAHIVFHVLDTALDEVRFMTRSGELIVTRGPGTRNTMSLPADPVAPYESPADVARQIGAALEVPPPRALFKGIKFLALWDDPAVIRGMKGPGDIARVLHALGLWSVIVTAPGDGDYDFVSRFFSTGYGIPEDPVTGSAHCALTPFWAGRLGKTQMKARQASPRGGDLYVTDGGARIFIAGDCALYLTGEIAV